MSRFLPTYWRAHVGGLAPGRDRQPHDKRHNHPLVFLLLATLAYLVTWKAWRPGLLDLFLQEFKVQPKEIDISEIGDVLKLALLLLPQLSLLLSGLWALQLSLVRVPTTHSRWDHLTVVMYSLGAFLFSVALFDNFLGDSLAAIGEGYQIAVRSLAVLSYAIILLRIPLYIHGLVEHGWRTCARSVLCAVLFASFSLIALNVARLILA